MRFLHQCFRAKKRQIIHVEMDSATKVKFMTANDFKAYGNARTHRFFGGSFASGDVRFVVPFDSVWYVVVEKGGYYSPLALQARCRLRPESAGVFSSVALDSPINEPGPVTGSLDEATNREASSLDLESSGH
jgi:Domain of unknown function (DUF1883)